jgi:hypothetical protein
LCFWVLRGNCAEFCLRLVWSFLIIIVCLIICELKLSLLLFLELNSYNLGVMLVISENWLMSFLCVCDNDFAKFVICFWKLRVLDVWDWLISCWYLFVSNETNNTLRSTMIWCNYLLLDILFLKIHFPPLFNACVFHIVLHVINHIAILWETLM